jgi:hypothetical protein
VKPRRRGTVDHVRQLLFGLAAYGLAAALPSLAAAQSEADLELVLAVDVSGSVDETEYGLQMSGIAAAFRDPEVHAAIAAGPVGRIAVSVVFWAESAYPKHSLPWTLIGDAAGAEVFAQRLERRPRSIPGGGTGLGRGVMHAVDLIEGNAILSPRRVVDVSGDGRETPHRYRSVPPSQARAYALARGVSINGLAILTDEPDLESYYRAEVIGGGEAFAMAANGFEDFAEAMRLKLIREIEYRPRLSGLDPGLRGSDRRQPAPHG